MAKKNILNLVHPKYRPDVDGLRAISILGVVIFHAFPEKIPGGFIGVDIFFVISGFLISTIIFSSLERDCFSLVEFYLRRVRRIFPALILVLIFCLTFGWIFLFSDEYKQLGKHIVAGSTFIENFILWHESGFYFDNSAETKPLIHFWSLAVEEQFYIFWPLLLSFIWKRHWSFLGFSIVIGIISFSTNIYLVLHGQAMAAFYLPFSRFWELMIGSILAYLVLHHTHLLQKYKDVQSYLGFILILLGFAFIHKGNHFPGFNALVPTLGAFLILSAGPTSSLNRRLLTNKPMIWLGLISYPLYLWHWSMLSFLRIIEGEIKPSFGLKLAVVLSAVLLAWLTYRFIEQPIRSGKSLNKKSLHLTTSMLFILVIGLINYKSNYLQRTDDRDDYVTYFMDDYLTREKMYEKYRSDCDFYGKPLTKRSVISKSCFTRDPSYSHALLLWGDSHVQQLYYGLKNNLPKDWQIILGVSSGCAANPDVEKSSNTSFCDQSNWKTLQTIKTAKPDVVIIGQINGHLASKMMYVASKLKKMGVKKIIFTGPVPQWDAPLHKIIARNCWGNIPKRTYLGINQEVINTNNQLVTHFKPSEDVLFVDLFRFLCNEQGCLTYIGKDKMRGLTTFDNGHLTPIASNKLAKEILVDKVIS